MWDVAKGGEHIGIYAGDSSDGAIRAAKDHAENLSVALPSGPWEAARAAREG